MSRQNKVILILLGAILLLAGTAATGFYYVLPRYAESWARRMIPHAATLLGRTIDVETVHLHSFSHLTLEGVSIASHQKGAPPLATIRRIDVRFRVVSFSERRIRLERVTIDGPAIRLVRRADGSSNYDDVVATLRRLLRRGKGSGRRSVLFQHVEKTIPELSIKNGALTLDDQSGRLQKLTGALSRLEFRQLAIDAHNPARFADERRLKFYGSSRLLIGDDAPFLFSGSIDVDERRAELTLTFPRPLDFVARGKSFRVAAVQLLGRRHFKLYGVAIAHRLKSGTNKILSAKALDVQLKAGANLAKSDGKLLQRVVGAIDKLVLDEPVFFINPYGRLLKTPKLFKRLAKRLEQEEPEPKPHRRRGRKRRRREREKPTFSLKKTTARVFERAKGRFDKLRAFLFAQVARFPLAHLEIHRGTVRAEDERAKKNGDDTLGTFNVVVRKQAGTGRFTFRVDFLRAGANPKKNHLEGELDPPTQNFRLKASIPELDLYGYSRLFPKMIRVQPSSSLRGTELSLVYDAKAQKLSVKGGLDYRNLEIVATWLASDALKQLDLALKTDSVLDLKENKLTFKSSFLSFNRLRFIFDGTITNLFEAPAFQLTVSLDETKLQDVFNSIPSALVPLLVGSEVSGTFSFYFKGFLDTADYDTLKYTIYSNLKNDFLVKAGPHINLERLNGSFVHLVEDDDTTIKVGIGPEYDSFTPLDQISEYMPKVVTTTEDGNFWKHKGFSTTQIRLSIIANLKKGRFYRGASTITQQLVKNLFLAREKTIARKLQEVLITWQIEKYLTKERIMELYLNV
ncbi:MAG: transglycosylase domain-containing protein, partial [Myxococcales bacterium]|nr:transglycosylase domain-containing protein [Myxococcales bacterium]